MASSSTGRPWHALRTPAMIFARLNGSVTPLRLTTASTASSTVVNRRPHSGQCRRRRISSTGSASRVSSDLLHPGLRACHNPASPPSGGSRCVQLVYELWAVNPNLWMTYIRVTTIYSATRLPVQANREGRPECFSGVGHPACRTGAASASAAYRQEQMLARVHRVVLQAVEPPDLGDGLEPVAAGRIALGDGPQRVARLDHRDPMRAGWVGRLARR